MVVKTLQDQFGVEIQAETQDFFETSRQYNEWISSSLKCSRSASSLTWIGAPILICNALAPMIRAFSNLVCSRIGLTMLYHLTTLRTSALP